MAVNGLSMNENPLGRKKETARRAKAKAKAKDERQGLRPIRHYDKYELQRRGDRAAVGSAGSLEGRERRNPSATRTTKECQGSHLERLERHPWALDNWTLGHLETNWTLEPGALENKGQIY